MIIDEELLNVDYNLSKEQQKTKLQELKSENDYVFYLLKETKRTITYTVETSDEFYISDAYED